VADLVGVNGNPLEDITTLSHPVFVMHEGSVVLADEKRPR
jgi:imidazolonepropionase-like amidohydrolase